MLTMDEVGFPKFCIGNPSEITEAGLITFLMFNQYCQSTKRK